VESHAPTAQTDVAGPIVLSYGCSVPRLAIVLSNLFELSLWMPVQRRARLIGTAGVTKSDCNLGGDIILEYLHFPKMALAHNP
jgi:hypothetical protein